jgi:hypothetical protein
VEAAFTGTGDFAEREKDGFMGNFQYIADRLPLCLSARSSVLKMPALLQAQLLKAFRIYWPVW